MHKSVSEKLNIDKSYYELLREEDKLKILSEYEKNHKMKYLMRNGLNDAPSISKADVSIAMGQIGQDITIEKSDVVLNNDNLEAIIKLKEISKLIHLVVIGIINLKC